MDDAALHILSAMRGSGSRAQGGNGPETAGARLGGDPLEAFACLVFGRPPGTLAPEQRRAVDRAKRAAWRDLRTARATPDAALVRAHPYREIYRAIRPLAGGRAAEAHGAAPDGASGARRGPRRPSALAIESLLRLRHRQRAALALRCVLAFSDMEVAYVLDLRKADAVRVLDRAAEGLRRRSGRSVDVSRALGAAGRDLRPSAASKTAGDPVPRVPRRVVRILVGDVPELPRAELSRAELPRAELLAGAMPPCPAAAVVPLPPPGWPFPRRIVRIDTTPTPRPAPPKAARPPGVVKRVLAAAALLGALVAAMLPGDLARFG